MITKNEFEEIYPLVNEIVVFTNSFANEDNPLFKYLKTRGDVYGSNDLMKIIRSNLLADLVHCYFALGYQQNYDSDYYLLFDLLQYAFWFEKDHFSYEDFEEYVSSQSNVHYFQKGFNNAKRDNDSIQFPALYISLIGIDQLKGAKYILILKKIVAMLSENHDEGTKSKEESVKGLLTYLESMLVSREYNNESLQIEDNGKYNMITNEEYEELYLLTRKIDRFVKLLTNKADCNSELSTYLKTIGCSFDNNLTLKDYVKLIIEKDILNCYFLLGYQQSYKRELFMLLDMIEYSFSIHEVPWSYKDFLNVYEIYNNFFYEVFNIKKNAIKSYDFPGLYLYLSEVGDARADDYISILQNIAITLSKKQKDGSIKDPRMDVLLTYPQAFLYSQDDNNESQQIDDDRDIQQIEEDNSGFNTDNNCQTMNLLKDKLYNGISFEIIGEEYHKGSSLPFRLYLRISNYNDQKKNISVDIKYISEKHGLKTRSGIFGDFVPDNSFVDLDVGFEDITGAYNGDRIEMEINEGKYASLRLIRERNQWAIVESIERSTYNRELKNKVENFEAIEEQFGITLQNFSVKVEDEHSLKVFCEVLALNGEIPKNDFTINIAIYDNNNEIVYTDSESKYAEEFKGFEVLTFDYIKLDITVDEISKIRIYPTR